MSPIEYVAAALVLVNVALVVRRSMWNYPFALVAVSLYGWLFLGEKLYSDALLQLFFLAVNLYGWWNWSRSRAETGEVRVERLSDRQRLAWLAGVAVAAAGWGWLMHSQTDAAYPWWDGSVAIVSIAAQILQSRRKWESWVLWIAADLLAVPLFAVKDLWPTAILYMILLVLAGRGLIDWIKKSA
ncbi:nicotinamide riboside transporter PnuC [Sphingomonas sp. HITSZ_GF]|uniref:nicotinamide riboside transporter PnuC n=1 Tax=Sphingomonas sp. HITSZ_GF TaxID=3037247 RepID=UPI00240D1515|nr:nicotinamide riboside transporter PnuC [Sphingomonas sp. HITSZ_GF]MDG2533948.1 nicotinamide riboside transporter PnuC [Sphingomonas sp. HITSZ_GF]